MIRFLKTLSQIAVFRSYALEGMVVLLARHG